MHMRSQFVSEKMGGAEGTKLDEDFVEMERKIEATSKAVAEVLSKTTEYLQPNPAYRAKLGMLNTMSKIRGQVKTTGYPQPEGLLGECMLRNGKDLGDDSNFGPALVDVGEALKQMAEVKDSLDIDVKQNFIDPLQILQEKDLKEIGHHLKKLEGRRLDYDYKKKRHGKIPDEEIRQAVDKFEESKELAEISMFNFLENDVEQISQLLALVDAALNYHKESTTILEELHNTLQHRITTASSRPKREFKPKPVVTLSLELCDNQPQNGLSYASSFKSSAKSSPFRFLRRSKHTFSPSSCTRVDQPFCKALYDFDPENEGELGFKEGDVIILTNQIDENWFEGMLDDESGFFPINYVQVIVPLPQ
ncbi:endophilin-A3a isoform X2 [Chiloscyllium plagiosum]|uniref:endophilin-A3a isoform X2 n=1 Tax=Chiloscyllium plagiosum TaxID=36176 RepID=UPI001CB818A8|nr:endophilin-A3a isoform X2 [Chiloscyllium plagiosum]